MVLQSNTAMPSGGRRAKGGEGRGQEGKAERKERSDISIYIHVKCVCM